MAGRKVSAGPACSPAPDGSGRSGHAGKAAGSRSRIKNAAGPGGTSYPFCTSKQETGGAAGEGYFRRNVFPGILSGGKDQSFC